MPGQTHSDPYYRPVSNRHDSNTMPSISESEYQEIMERNKAVSTSAIARAVDDTSMGECSIRFDST